MHLLCIGAHSDDLEIGCSGTLFTWLSGDQPFHVTWVVLTASGARATEASASARALLKRAHSRKVVLGELRDGFLPAQYEAAKTLFESLKTHGDPDLIFTHRLEDRHQDHRLTAELTWNTWRNHLILEYEVLKFEGDLGQPNVFVPLSTTVARRKLRHLQRHFGSQRSKHWFDDASFKGLARLRGIECRSPSGFAEAFHGRKLVLAAPGAGS